MFIEKSRGNRREEVQVLRGPDNLRGYSCVRNECKMDGRELRIVGGAGLGEHSELLAAVVESGSGGRDVGKGNYTAPGPGITFNACALRLQLEVRVMPSDFAIEAVNDLPRVGACANKCRWDARNETAAQFAKREPSGRCPMFLFLRDVHGMEIVGGVHQRLHGYHTAGLVKVDSATGFHFRHTELGNGGGQSGGVELARDRILA
jgi:hypothetical protein